MSTERFDLLFSGQLVKGFDLDTAKSNVQKLFRLDKAKTDILFSGKTIALKKNLDFDTAAKYRVAMKKAGVVVSLQERESAPAASPPPVVDKPAAASVLSTALGAQAESAKHASADFDAPDFGVAEMAGYLVKDEERDRPVAANIDVSELSLKEAEGFLMEAGEVEQIDVSAVPVPDFDVAPAGSDVLTDDERARVEAVDVDTSGLSLAEVGERLGPAAKSAPPAPKVDHITLVE